MENKKITSEIAIGIILFVAIILGGIFWLQGQGVKDIQTKSNMSTKTIAQSQQSANVTCDNYECLISAASQCQPISATISYSGLPNPLFNGLTNSGKTKYEIQKSSGVNNCILTFTILDTSTELSDQGRATALSNGVTNAKIDAQLQTINDNLKSALGLQTVCSSNANAISTFLNDAKSGITSLDSNGQTTTYTTSTGQKLACTVAPSTEQQIMTQSQTNTESANDTTNINSTSNAKSDIDFTIEDQNGKLLNGILCEVTTNDKNHTKMITVASEESNANGKCSFQGLDPANSYLVRVYWTKDKSRDSMIGLGFIAAGTTAAKVVVRPSGI